MKDVTKQTNVVAVELDGWQTQQPKRTNPRFTFPSTNAWRESRGFTKMALTWASEEDGQERRGEE